MNFAEVMKPPIAAPRSTARLPRNVSLRDGGRLRLQELRAVQREQLQAFFARCSPEALYQRFLAPIKAPAETLLDYLANADGARHVALVLTQREGGGEAIIAEGRYALLDERPTVASVACLVAEPLRRRGLATLLLGELTQIACRNGVTHFSADVLAGNRALLALLHKTVLARSISMSHGVIHFEIPLACRNARPISEAGSAEG